MPQRRWTLVVVQDHSPFLRGVSFPERALRAVLTASWVAVAVTVVGLASTIIRAALPREPEGAGRNAAVGELSQQLGHVRRAIVDVQAREIALATSVGVASADSLDRSPLPERRRRGTVAGDVDTRDRASSPAVPVMDPDRLRGTADSLLGSAAIVSSRFETLADSVGRGDRRSATRPAPTIMPTPEAVARWLTPADWNGGVRASRAGRAVRLLAPRGALVLAPSDGKVTRLTSRRDGYVDLVVEYDDGRELRLRNALAAYVAAGDRVTAGQVIVATREPSASGALSIESWIAGRPADPAVR
jgi:hypothetical protein